MAKILFLAHRLPYPPDRGDRIRSFHFLHGLARRHEIALAAVADEPVDPGHLSALEGLCQSVDVAHVPPRARWMSVLRCLPTTTPVTLPAFFSPVLADRIARRLDAERFDLVFIYCSAMAPYVLSCRSVPKVIDFVDADSEKWFDYARRTWSPLKALYWREGVLLRRYERRVAGACAHAFVTTDREANILRPLAPATPITTIPNGVIVRVARAAPGRRRLVFTGVMDYWPNVDAMIHFVREILPRIRAAVGDVELVIVGQRPAPKVQRLGRLPGVTVTGWVPDVSTYLQSAAAFVAPLRIARGIPNKVLEAMATGLPVIATTPAIAGLGAVPGRHVLIGDTAHDFAAETISVLLDNERQERLGRAALDFVREAHSWDTHVAQLDAVITEVIERSRTHADNASRTERDASLLS